MTLSEATGFAALSALSGAMAALRVRDFDMLRRRVNVSRSVTEAGGLVWSTPKISERALVLFPASLADELSELMVGKSRVVLVFTDMRDAFSSIVPHSLRHTAGVVGGVGARMSRRCNGCSVTRKHR